MAISKFVQKLKRPNGQGGDGAVGADVDALVKAGAGTLIKARTIAFDQIAQQVVKLVRAALAETDYDSYHYLQDLYYDNGALFAVTVSAGRLWRWPVMLDRNDEASIGEPVIVKVNFSVTNEAPTGRMATIRQTSDGRWLGASVLCTATVNKMGILDSRGLFDSFIQRFQGDGSEYINLLHLGGGISRIGVMRHIFRDDKLLVGIYEFDKEDPVALAAARTLAADTTGYWGGSIEFKHFGDPTLLEVADGISLPVTTDGEFLGYSFARSQDCAAWSTCNIIFQERGLMTDQDRAVALELLGDEELVKQLAARLGDTNRTLEGAITYTLEETRSPGDIRLGDTRLGDTRPGELVPGAGELLEYELDEAAVATLSDLVMARAVRPLVDERTAALRSHFDDLMTTFETRVAAATAGLTALDTRVGERLALLEKDDQTRYQQYDQAKPPQPVIKLGVRPRVVAAGGVVKVVEVEESAFARKAREKRQKQ